MKLKIKETTEKQIDIEFPYHTSNGLHFFKFDENENCTVVYKSKFNSNEFEISKRTKRLTPDDWWLCPQITKEEFDAEYNKVLELIQKKL